MVTPWIALTSEEYDNERGKRKRERTRENPIHSLFVFMVRDRSDEMFEV